MRTSMLLLFTLMFTSAAQANPVNYHLDFSSMKAIYTNIFSRYHNTSSYKGCTFYALTDAEELTIYNRAVKRLRTVANWASLISIPGQEFKLFNAQGLGVNREAIKGDYISIKLPLDPTRRAYWVRVESLSQKDNLASGESVFTMVVRPTEKPNAKGRTVHYTDHFFTKAATNTFSLKRTRGGLEARVDGEHERANTTEAPTKLDRVSNTTIAVMGWGVNVDHKRIGFQPLVWRKFNAAVADCQL